MNPEPTPWLSGLLVTACTAVFTGGVLLGVYSVAAQMRPWLGVLAVVVVCGGTLPTVWLRRRRPVWRWVSAGVMAGAVVALVGSVVLTLR
ncbi:DUF2537 domain-containing protein [Williamsia sterculiae]|uniref:DUF2537 domain-containing protein n=1 Tax=Williamsia sterculiae TaxID=1344003 RepID=A0A1N7GVH3_9NOCA|nr:DUF2537 domain-containing protein [Williamsia sterculiae]SIS16603.1 Protein of unknown function [Williamsia sterculiae]